MWLGSFSFIAAIFISYFFIGFGLIEAYKLIGLKNYFYYFVGSGAIVVGLFGLRDYFKNKGVSCNYNSKLQKVLSKANNPWTMFVAGLFCSLFLLPCTSGPYVVMTGLIAGVASKILWLTIYNLIFILPLVAIAVLSIKSYGALVYKWQLENQNKINLVSALLMLSIGLGLIIYILTLSTGSTCVI
jgi:cytochrome c biogenesis protein CcdA